MGKFTEDLKRMINVKSDLPTEVDVLLRLGAEEGHRLLAVAERHGPTQAITGFSLWLCEHTRPHPDSHPSYDYGKPTRSRNHFLEMVQLVGEGLSIWKLRRMMSRIKGMSTNRMHGGPTKLQLTIWRGRAYDPKEHGEDPHNLDTQDGRRIALVLDNEGAERLWVLVPINPDVRRTGL